MARLTRTLRFHLERWIQRGVFHQLLFVAALIVSISVLGGLVAWAATDEFDSPLAGIWWSFLRLTDPGYLGDDEGAVLRLVSTIVTVLGYVLFMGSLIAIMTQWLSRTLRRMESGLAPISMRGHVVILGWTNRTAEIVGDLLGARGRLDRFLARHRRRRLRIVVVADEVDSERRARLRAELGHRWRSRQIFLRAGSPLQYVDLLRFDLLRAAAIILPGDEFEFGGEDGSDTRVVKTLLNLRRILGPVPEADRPAVVAEVFDPRRIPVARAALKGVQVVPGDAVIARLIAQTIRDPRLAPIFLDLLSHQRLSSPFVRCFPELAGHHPMDLEDRFPLASVIGAVRRERGENIAHLNPPRDFRLDSADLLAFIAPNYAACTVEACEAADPPGPPEPLAPTQSQPPGGRRILILGWSRKVGVILEELSAHDVGPTEVTLVSRVPRERRIPDLLDHTIDTERVRIEHVERDYTGSGMFAEVDPEAFDTVVLLASTRMPDHDHADARTILGYGLLRSVLDERVGRLPSIVVEFVDAANGRLFPHSRDVHVVSPMVLAFLQTHVALRPELNSVFHELFAPGGAQVTMRAAEEYGLAGRTFRYRDVERAARARGEVALGVLPAPAGESVVELCPPANREWSGSDGAACVVLARERDL